MLPTASLPKSLNRTLPPTTPQDHALAQTAQWPQNPSGRAGWAHTSREPAGHAQNHVLLSQSYVAVVFWSVSLCVCLYVYQCLLKHSRVKGLFIYIQTSCLLDVGLFVPSDLQFALF